MTAIGSVRSRPASTKPRATSFKGRGVQHHVTARGWSNVSMVQEMAWKIILVDKPSLPIWTGPRKSNRMRYDNFVSMKFIYRPIEIISVQDTLIRFPPLTHLRSMIQPSAVHWGFTLITTKTSQMMRGSVKKWKSCRWGVWCTSNNALPIVQYLTFHFASVSASPISQTWMDMLLEQRELEEMEIRLLLLSTKSWFKPNWVSLIFVYACNW